jgi:REP element-mobilizing transposase RayT
MPEHVHLLIRRHRDKAERMLAEFQNASRDDLIAERRRRGNHPVWGGPGWKGVQSTRDDLERTVRYVEANPLERNLPAQQWDFAKPYDGWLPAGAKY